MAEPSAAQVLREIDNTRAAYHRPPPLFVPAETAQPPAPQQLSAASPAAPLIDFKLDLSCRLKVSGRTPSGSATTAPIKGCPCV